MSERKAGGVPADGLSLAVWRALLHRDATPQRARAIVEAAARRHGAVAVSGGSRAQSDALGAGNGALRSDDGVLRTA